MTRPPVSRRIVETPARRVEQELVAFAQAMRVGDAVNRECHALVAQNPGERHTVSENAEIPGPPRASPQAYARG
jgi:hypothetical protein